MSGFFTRFAQLFLPGFCPGMLRIMQVEKAVNIVYRHVYAPLRHQSFTSLEALNKAMAQQLSILNDKPYKNTPYSRRWFFEDKEYAILKALPPAPFTTKK